MSKIIDVNDDNFKSIVLESSQPVLVDFWAEWCGPCKVMTTVLEEVIENYPQIKFVKFNIDEGTNIPAQYSVRAIPTLILFEEGEPIAVKTGALSKSQLSEFIQLNHE